MTCEVLNGERFERVLAHRATAEDVDLLRRHLETACEACLERLAGVDDELILRALAGPRADLTPAEAEHMFRAASPAPVVRLTRWPLAAAAALLIAATTGAFLFRDDSDLRDKGTLSIELLAFAGKKVGDRPVIDRRLAQGEFVAKGERVLFRHRLTAPAHLYLIAQYQQTSELLFSEYVPAGEHELAQGGQALALDPTGMGPALRIIAIASVDPIERDHVSCTACSKDQLDLVVE